MAGENGVSQRPLLFVAILVVLAVAFVIGSRMSSHDHSKSARAAAATACIDVNEITANPTMGQALAAAKAKDALAHANTAISIERSYKQLDQEMFKVQQMVDDGDLDATSIHSEIQAACGPLGY